MPVLELRIKLFCQPKDSSVILIRLSNAQHYSDSFFLMHTSALDNIVTYSDFEYQDRSNQCVLAGLDPYGRGKTRVIQSK